MSAETILHLFNEECKPSPTAAVSIATEPLRACPIDQVAPALRCLYCERCGLFLGTFVDTMPHEPFSCAFAAGKHCLCTLPTDMLCALVADVESSEAYLLARGRLVDAFASAGCDLAQASVVTAGFLPISDRVKAWLLRHLSARPYQPGRWQN